jgi:hypothetical protein
MNNATADASETTQTGQILVWDKSAAVGYAGAWIKR